MDDAAGAPRTCRPSADHAAASGFDHAPAEPEACRRPRTCRPTSGDGSFRRNGSRHGGSRERALLRVAPLLPLRESRHFSSQNVPPCSVMSPLRTPRGLLSRWLVPASQTAPSRTPISDSDFRLPTRTGLGLRPPSRIRISDSDLGLGARTSDYRVPSDGCPFAVGALLLVAPSDRRARHTSGSLHGPTAPPCDVHCTASDEARMA
jgi:hypothetical protein